MKYLHTMVRISSVEDSLDFYCNKLGLIELRRQDDEKGRYTNIFLAAPGNEDAMVELTHNWDPEEYAGGRNFGHLAYGTENIYALCQHLMDNGVTINRPPTGHPEMAAWHLSDLPTIFQSNCCNRVTIWHQPSRGCRCPTRVHGEF